MNDISHSYPDALIVAALTAAFVAWMYFRHRERQHRVEIVHKERLVALEKGVPLPELPLDPPKTAKPSDPREILLHGIVWMALGAGGMATLAAGNFFPGAPHAWSLTLPLVFLGVGLILFYVLASKRTR